jgi:hypothetical protein
MLPVTTSILHSPYNHDRPTQKTKTNTNTNKAVFEEALQRDGLTRDSLRSAGSYRVYDLRGDYRPIVVRPLAMQVCRTVLFVLTTNER